MRAIKYIIVHCTATKAGQNVSVKDVDRWHKERGFECIGYHYLITLDGSICKGREEAKVGAHCVGYNTNSIGVCYVGGLNKQGKAKDTRTLEQKMSLIKLLGELKKKYPTAQIVGHRNFAKKDCPCFDAKKEYLTIK